MGVFRIPILYIVLFFQGVFYESGQWRAAGIYDLFFQLFISPRKKKDPKTMDPFSDNIQIETTLDVSRKFLF